ncbi:monocarboxylate transporter 10-like isoform X2 [Neocloeon triangulifer]|uniref:monocarboxylate transporter 10-like isoform X2 n=1 Tax=Neocloeon triangulifer TaxID=2078957 RepID=UPI00286F6C10|nr:monocarboxylate transporter 10-like isoform X2 [Neocloeon triangulifer]
MDPAAANEMVPKNPWAPADGGFRAWLVVAASFIIHGLVFGINLSYSVIYYELQRILDSSGVTDTSYKTSLVGSLSLGMTFAFSALAGILIDRLGNRMTAIIGGSLALIGMLASSFVVQYVEALYFTYGILFGCGASLSFNPSLSVLGLHFRRRIGLVCGIATAGASVFTFILPPVLGALIPSIGLDWTLRVVALLMIIIIAVSFAYTVPEGANVGRTEEKKLKIESFLNVKIWKNKKFVIWTIGVPFAFFGYFVPFVHLVKFVSINFPGDDGKTLVMCIGVASAVGRVGFGLLSDHEKINRVLLQQISLFLIGIFTMLLVPANAWIYMILLCLGIGLADGCFISLIGPIAFDLCGPEGAAQAIGFVNGISAISVTLGPTIAVHISR